MIIVWCIAEHKIVYTIAVIIIFVSIIFFLFVYSFINSALDIVFNMFSISLPSYMNIVLRWVLTITVGVFIVYNIIDYMHILIVCL